MEPLKLLGEFCVIVYNMGDDTVETKAEPAQVDEVTTGDTLPVVKHVTLNVPELDDEDDDEEEDDEGLVINYC